MREGGTSMLSSSRHCPLHPPTPSPRQCGDKKGAWDSCQVDLGAKLRILQVLPFKMSTLNTASVLHLESHFKRATEKNQHKCTVRESHRNRFALSLSLPIYSNYIDIDNLAFHRSEKWHNLLKPTGGVIGNRTCVDPKLVHLPLN